MAKIYSLPFAPFLTLDSLSIYVHVHVFSWSVFVILLVLSSQAFVLVPLPCNLTCMVLVTDMRERPSQVRWTVTKWTDTASNLRTLVFVNPVIFHNISKSDSQKCDIFVWLTPTLIHSHRNQFLQSLKVICQSKHWQQMPRYYVLQRWNEDNLKTATTHLRGYFILN